MLGICRLKNEVQRYDWGSSTALAELLGRPSPAPGPEAELWMGAHAKAPSQALVGDRWVSLRDLLRDRAEEVLGAPASAAGEFPYLFKVLAVERPLSIQTHPDRSQAIEGCRREDELGIPRHAYERNYRDDQPKPEILYAVTSFRMLRGFRPAAEVGDLCRRFGLAALGSESEDLESLFRAWMDLDPPRLAATLEGLMPRCRELASEGDAEARCILQLSDTCPGDRGVLAPLLLHLRELQPGDAVHTGPGVLHAYLEGLGIELMTSSDNVVRCGLTSKHCDVPELLRILRFKPDPPRALEPDDSVDGARRFEVPDAGLVLSVLDLGDGRSVTGYRRHGVEILLCTEGAGRLTADDGVSLELERGDSVLIPSSAGSYRLDGSGRLYRAGVTV